MRRVLFLVLVLVGLHARAMAQDAVAPCYKVHGRLSYYNGTPSTRIWIVGTRRMLSLPGEDRELPANVKALLKDFDDNIFGDFIVCPLREYQKGHMQAVFVKSASHLVDRREKSH